MQLVLSFVALVLAPAYGLQSVAGVGRLRSAPVRARPCVAMAGPFDGLFGGKSESSAPSRPAPDEALAFKDPETLTPDEERKLKLEVGTNWRPRTSTVKGEGYQFFQGPTPKTSVQDGLPDFFSSENFADSDLELGKVFIPLAGALTLGLVGFIIVS